MLMRTKKMGVSSVVRMKDFFRTRTLISRANTSQILRMADVFR